MLVMVFIISIVYWIYLYFNTSMVIVFDAVGYEQLGHLLHTQGWVAYFKSGPNREPFFPLTIAMSMGLADFLHVSYQKIQLAFQVCVLGFSQILLWRLLIRLKVHHLITAIVLLYWAFSPAIVNSAFSLFSEIMAYPCILIFIWFSLDLLDVNHQQRVKQLINGVMWGVAAFALVMVKAISVYMVMAVGIWILAVLAWRWQSHQQRNWMIVGALLLGLVVLQAGVVIYKSLNKHYNGFYVLTDRGPLMLYGNIYRRVQPHDAASIKAALALVPGEGVCRSRAKEEDCRYWQFMTSDGFGTKRLVELSQSGYTTDQINRALMQESKDFIKQNPVPVVFFGMLEGLKMFFWESTQVGFVTYPEWLTKVYNQGLLKSLLRLVISLLTFIACIGFAYHSLKLKDHTKILLMMMALIFIGSYSCVTVLTRYAFPIVPIYLLIIGCWLNQLLIKR